jgi:ferrous iron transport protein B
VLLINILVAVGVFDAVINLFSPLMEGLLGLPGEATPALVIGFLRKDMAVGMLYPLGLSAMQLVIAVTMLTMYFPCVATFVVIFKELGLRDLIKASMVMVGVALLVGTILRLILIGV